MQGILVYTPTGYMSAVLHGTREDVRPLTITYPDLLGGVGEVSAWSLVGTYSVAYAGMATTTTTSPDDTTNGTSGTDSEKIVTSGMVRHGPLISATVPQWIGTTQTRKFEVFDETASGGSFVLKLSAEDPVTRFRTDAFWSRVG